MRYTATIYGWNEGQEPQQLQVIDSKTYTPIPGKPSDCAFEAARDAVFMYLDKDWENCRIDLHSEIEEGENDGAWQTQVPDDSSLFYGAFTHPVRGRILFAAGDCGFEGGDYSLELLAETRKAKMAEADIPIYSPNQLFEMKALHTCYDESWSLVEHYLKDFFPMNNYLDSAGYDKIDKQKRIQVRYLAHVGLGSDESWTLATLWFKPVVAMTDEYFPVAVLTYQGEDYEYDAYITNMQLLGDLVAFIQSHMPMEHRNIVDPDKPEEKYTEFWGHKLADFYDVKTGLPVRPPSTGKNAFGYETTAWSHYGLWGDDVKYAPEEKK